MTADEIGATGVTISNGALFSAIPSGNAALPVGTVSTVIDNTAALAISGRLNNLPNGDRDGEQQQPPSQLLRRQE